MSESSPRRQLLRRVPLFSRLVSSIDALEADKQHLEQWAHNLEDENRRVRDENVHLHRLITDRAEENQRLQRLLTTLTSPQLLGDPTSGASAMAPDGWPLPPPLMRYWVAGTDDQAWFLEGGALGARAVTETLARNGIAFDSLPDVLDFGCGCGRVLRALSQTGAARLHGSDCNAVAIAWAQQHLPFARFETNPLAPPTRYAAHTFDAIYAFSVFSHFPEALQVPWMDELHRILKPGGLLLMSVHGDHYIDRLNAEERETYRSGHLTVLASDRAGANECAAFHPEAYVRHGLARRFDVLEMVAEGALGNPRQDLYLLRSKSS